MITRHHPRRVRAISMDVTPITPPVHDYGVGRTCPVCERTMNRYQRATCSRCERESAELGTVQQAFTAGMDPADLRATVQAVFGNYRAATRLAGVHRNTISSVVRGDYSLSAAMAQRLNEAIVHVEEVTGEEK